VDAVSREPREALRAALEEARRRRIRARALRTGAPALATAAAIALAALVVVEWRGARVPLSTRGVVAIACIAFAAAASFVAIVRAGREPIARALDRSLRSEGLLETAAEQDGAAERAGLPALLVRAAARLVARERPQGEVISAPGLGLGAALLAAILLLAFLPRLGRRGPDESGLGVRPEAAGGVARAGAPSRQPAAGAPERKEPDRKEEKSPATGNSPMLPPEPIPAFTATPKLVPIDPGEGPRRRRPAVVLDVADEGADAEAAAQSGAEPGALPAILDATRIAELRRAAERALAVDAVTERERALAARYFELLVP